MLRKEFFSFSTECRFSKRGGLSQIDHPSGQKMSSKFPMVETSVSTEYRFSLPNHITPYFRWQSLARGWLSRVAGVWGSTGLSGTGGLLGDTVTSKVDGSTLIISLSVSPAHDVISKIVFEPSQPY